MPLVLKAPKKIVVGTGEAAITFLVRTPHKVFNEWWTASQKFFQEFREYADPLEPRPDENGKLVTPDKPEDYDRHIAAFQVQERDLDEKALAFIVGWEGVTDETGKPADYSREALDELDTAYVAEIFYQLGLHGRRIGLQVAEGNAP